MTRQGLSSLKFVVVYHKKGVLLIIPSREFERKLMRSIVESSFGHFHNSAILQTLLNYGLVQFSDAINIPVIINGRC